MPVSPQCPVTFASRVLGGRWAARIVHLLLRNERLRFSELRRGCHPISDRILSKELKDLGAWGLVARHDYRTIPPRTDYRLTDLGRTLHPVMDAMVVWGTAAQVQIAEWPAAEQDDPRALPE